LNPHTEPSNIKLEHGSGGALSRELVDSVIYPFFSGADYRELSDASPVMIEGEILITTDTYVVDPPFFPGGDIGELAVFGTCNDLAVSGAKPRFLTLGFVLEEGLPLSDLRRILRSIAKAAEEAQVKIVTGDTKVVPQGKGGGIFINTTGIGQRVATGVLSPSKIEAGDAVIVTGPVGSHGTTILAARESLNVSSKLFSDCAFLFPLCEKVFGLKEKLRFLRDATRGGLAAILNEIVADQSFSIWIREKSVPVEENVAATAEILGLNPLEIANEGVVIAVVAGAEAQRAVSRFREHSMGRQATIIGEVRESYPGKVILLTPIGGRRILDFPRGLILPRIC
jgi:hydrogenase expression/formation protein HypE